jgi:hypothetical protein
MFRVVVFGFILATTTFSFLFSTCSINWKNIKTENFSRPNKQNEFNDLNILMNHETAEIVLKST